MSEHHHDESEHEGIQPDTELSLPARRALAINELLVEKGIISAGEVRERAEAYRCQKSFRRRQGRREGMDGP